MVLPNKRSNPQALSEALSFRRPKNPNLAFSSSNPDTARWNSHNFGSEDTWRYHHVKMFFALNQFNLLCFFLHQSKQKSKETELTVSKMFMISQSHYIPMILGEPQFSAQHRWSQPHQTTAKLSRMKAHAVFLWRNKWEWKLKCQKSPEIGLMLVSSIF